MQKTSENAVKSYSMFLNVVKCCYRLLRTVLSGKYLFYLTTLQLLADSQT